MVAEAQNKVEMCREELSFINQSCKSLEAELVKQRNIISVVSNELAEGESRKASKEEYQALIDLLMAEVNRIKKDNDKIAVTLN
ncbi:MAG: hypothetical protein JST59_01885 [Actinobacteria bacterium]|nr:hypothetical protein [Actinomycetota bacterium]